MLVDNNFCGFWGLRYNKKDKITIINISEPEIIGAEISRFCKAHKYKYELENLYNRINLVDPFEDVDDDDKKKIKNILPDTNGKCWADLLYKTRDDIFLYADGLRYMTDYSSLLKESYKVKFGYIINIDNMCLEIWRGKQNIPQRNNRYGIKLLNGFYPCRLICQYQWGKITDGLKDYKDIELLYKEVQRKYNI